MENRAMGCIFSPYDSRDYQLVCGANTQQVFPKKFELEPRRVKDQGSTGSCVAHTLSSIIEYYNYNQNNDDTEMSIGYIYGNRRNSSYKGEGLIMRDALATVCKYGDCPKEEFPYNKEVPEAIQLFEKSANHLFPLGEPHRITEYCRVNDEASIKMAIMSGCPVAIALNWYNDIQIDKFGVAHSNFNEKDMCGGHCVSLVGWDESGWKILNSWGTNWGNEGYFIWPYEYPIEESWIVIDDNIEGLVIKKPYHSKLGKYFAKIINKIKNLIFK